MARLAKNVIAVASAVFVFAAGPGATRSWAHAGDRVQLHLARISASAEGPSEWRIHVAVVDADSGRPAPGFRVSVTGQAAGGRMFGPRELADPTRHGDYEGMVAAAPGAWSVSVQARELPGGERAVPLDTTVSVEFVSAGQPERPAARETPEPTTGPRGLVARLERGDDAAPSPNWVSLRVVVADATAGAVSEGLEVFVVARDAAGRETEAAPLGPTREDGLFSGFAIVPHGGQWRFTAVVNRKRADGEQRPPETYATASLEAEISAVALETSRTAAAAANARGVKGSSFEALVLWLHSLLAIAWLMGVGALAAIGQPRVRRLLSSGGAGLIDGRVEALARGAGWLTVGVVATGVYNLVKSTPYRVPLTPARWQEVGTLPYGRPYYGMLLAKVVIYAAMVAVAVPLIRRARHASSAWLPDAASERPAEPTSSPWGGPRRGATTTMARPAAAVVPSDPEPGYGLETLLAAGALLVSLAVTLLKYLHLLSETVRR